MANYGLLDMPNTDPWRGVLSDPRSAYRTQYAEPQPQPIVTPDSRDGRTPESYGLMGNQAPRPAPWEISSGLAESLSPMVQGYGAGQMASYARDALGSGDYGTATGAGLMAAMSMLPMKKGAAPVAAAERPTGIRAYHGSPHDFDRFDISKIGTGEGAQAYGHGLYFAENEGVAKSYRDSLAYKHQDHGAEWQADSTLKDFGGDKEKAKAHLNYMISQYPDPYYSDNFKKAIEYIDAGKPTGRMYEVNIKADPEHFLDWDKPLSQQSEKVRQSLESLIADEKVQASLRSGRETSDDLRKLNMGAMAQFIMQDGVAGKNALNEAGIPGIRYLDQGSRGAGEGSRNYVVFDPATIEIMRKYGLMGPMAGGVAAGAATQQPRSLLDQ